MRCPWRTGEIARASTDSHGNQVEGDSNASSISGNGRYVAFQSLASLVLEDTNNSVDVYVKDLRTDEVTLVSTNPQGSAGNEVSGDPSISGNGRYVAFISLASDLVVGDDNGDYDVYLKDLRTDEVTLVSEALGGGSGNLNSGDPSVTNDGDVVFVSRSSDLVAQDTNGLFDIFLWA
jgi:Tol biopolymer transport system component